MKKVGRQEFAVRARGRGRKQAAGIALAARAMPIAALLLGACSPPPAPPPPAPTVIAAAPVLETGPQDVSYAGEVRPRFEAALAFRVDGKLVARTAHLGEHVHAGQVLAQLDPDDNAAATAAAQAALAAAQSRLGFARQQRDRDAAQLKDDLVSRAQAEQSDSAYAVAAAEVEQRRQELAHAQNQSRYTELLADHDGYITSESAEVGAYVKAGQAVLGLAWDGQSDVVIDVPESRIRQITRGQPASVTLTAAPDRPLQARVRDLAAVADPQSRSFRVRLALSRPQEALLGATAQVRFAAAAAPRRLVLPATALFHDGPAPAVWVVSPADHSLSLRKVEVAAYGSDTITLAGGLAADERVVVQGAHAVNAGEHVDPVAPRSESSGAGERP